MPPRRCCCGDVECLILLDNFGRNVDPDPNWETISGSPVYSGTDLTLDAGDKVATYATNTSSTRGVASVVFTGTGSPCMIKVTLNYGDVDECVATATINDTTLYLEAGAQSRTIDDTSPSGKSTQLIWQRSSTDQYIVQVALTNNMFYIRLYGNDGDPRGGAVWDHQFTRPTTGDRRLAIECTAGTVVINGADGGVEYYRHYHDKSDCPDYGCHCEDAWYVPWKTRVDFFSTDGEGLGCDAFDGGYLLFESAVDGGDEEGSNRWECVDGLLASVGYGYGTAQNPFFECNLILGSPFTISFSPYLCFVTDTLATTSYTCNPFVVNYQLIISDDIPYCEGCVDGIGTYYGIMTDDT